MKIVQIKFYDMEQIRKFVRIMDTIDEPLELHCEQIRINAKSILGILSLDFSKPLTLECDKENCNFENRLKEFLV